MVFAGARFSLFTADGRGVGEIKGDKQGLGYRRVPHNVRFTNHEIELAPGRVFYMTTDGMIDQVGGEKRRMYGKRRFTELLRTLVGMPLAEQKGRLIEALQDYQGNEIRRDDVSLIGFKISN
jgi:serine phosphatase RsbU (regulator of sigma subunit)